MRSVRTIQHAAALGGAALAATALCGCVSTQTKNARTVLVNQRELVSENVVHVTAANPAVTVSGVELIHSRSGDAVAVTVHNLATHPVSDLPISIGVRRRHGRATYLNGAANLPYFATHIAGIGASATTVWVDTLRRAPALAGGSVFAVVGVPGLPLSAAVGSLDATRAGALPRLQVTAAPDGSRLQVAVLNTSGVPQYELPVYAIATRDGRTVGAASGLIGTLNGGSRTRLALKVFGTTTGATVQLSAPPTIFK